MLEQYLGFQLDKELVSLHELHKMKHLIEFYTSKLIDYSASYQTRHAEGVIEMQQIRNVGQVEKCNWDQELAKLLIKIIIQKLKSQRHCRLRGNVVISVMTIGITVVLSPLKALIDDQVFELINAEIPCYGLYASTAQPVNYNYQQKVFRVDQRSSVFSEGPEVLNHVRYFSKYCKQILVNYFSWQGDPMPEEVIDAIIKVKQQVNRNDVVDVFR
nr:4986_t:CDS:2 [Entrophospora candida]